MKRLNISEARNTLPALVESVSTTRVPVILLRYGKPAAMLVPVDNDEESANPYPLRGVPITVSNDFDAPLPALWEACDVAEKPEGYISGEKRKSKASRKGEEAMTRRIVSLSPWLVAFRSG